MKMKRAMVATFTLVTIVLFLAGPQSLAKDSSMEQEAVELVRSWFEGKYYAYVTGDFTTLGEMFYFQTRELNLSRLQAEVVRWQTANPNFLAYKFDFSDLKYRVKSADEEEIMVLVTGNVKLVGIGNIRKTELVRLLFEEGRPRIFASMPLKN